MRRAPSAGATASNGSLSHFSADSQDGFRVEFSAKSFAAYIPFAFFGLGGISAIHPLWAGPWLIEMAGNTRAATAQMLSLIWFWGLSRQYT